MRLSELIERCPRILEAHLFLSDPLTLDDWHTTHLFLTHKNDEGGSVAPEVRSLLEAEDATASPPEKT